MTTDEYKVSIGVESVAHRILLVEDDPDNATFVKELLEANGYKVTVAKDGGQAQTTFVMRQPDFVILDIMLPGESGFEICNRFKKTNEHIPILFLSAISLADAKLLAEKVGANGYLTKPFEPEELLRKIIEISQQAWEKSHLEQPGEVARIRFHCRCGKKFKVSPSHRGKTMTCPQCGDPVIVPRYS